MLRLEGRGLAFVDVSAVPAVEHLNLRLNFLRTVKGLKTLQHLRTVDLRWNPRLKIKDTVAHIAGTKTNGAYLAYIPTHPLTLDPPIPPPLHHHLQPCPPLD